MVEFDCAVCTKHVEQEVAERTVGTSMKEAEQFTRQGFVLYVDRWESGPEPEGGWPCPDHAAGFATRGRTFASKA